MGDKMGDKVHHGAAKAFSTRVAMVGGIIMVARGKTASRQAKTADAMAFGRALSKREADDMGGGLAEDEGYWANTMARCRGCDRFGTGLQYVGGNPGVRCTRNGEADLANPKTGGRIGPVEVDLVGGLAGANMRCNRGGHDVGHGGRRRGELGGQGNDERVASQGCGCGSVRSAVLTPAMAWRMVRPGTEGVFSTEIMCCYVEYSTVTHGSEGSEFVAG